MIKEKTNLSNRAFNTAAASIGFLIFVCGIWLLLGPSSVVKIDYRITYFVICVGTGLLLFAVGDEANFTERKYTLTGASAISLTFYYVLTQHPPTPAVNEVAAKVEVSAADSAFSTEMMSPSSHNRPTSSAIVYSDGYLSGKLRHNPYSYVFEFNIKKEDIGNLDNTECPLLIIGFADGHEKRASFVNHKVMSVGKSYYFDLIFKVDKNKSWYRRDQQWAALDDCDTAQGKEIAVVNAQANAERDISKTPTPTTTAPVVVKTNVNIPAAALIPQPPSAQAIHSDQIAAQPPSEAIVAPNKSKILGYVVISQLTPDAGHTEKNWFDIDGKVDALVPTQNDTITLNAEAAVIRSQPYHWNAQSQKHVVGKPVFTMKRGQKAKIAGDSLIVRDETNNNSWYVISPISEVIGANNERSNDIYPDSDLPDDVKGYVYIGYLNKSGAAVSDKSFDNFSYPDAVYPSPNDILVARSNIWLREGPRRWDAEKSVFTKPDIVTSIHKGDYIQVAGDIVIARGISLWVPVSKKSPFPKGKQPELTTWNKIQNLFQ